VLRSARAAPATVVTHLERWAKNKATMRNFVNRILGIVSYACVDASEYAKDLALALRERAFARFLDVESIQPGSDIKVTLRRALKKSSFVILLVTEGAFRSEWVPWEVATFAKKNPGNVLPVEIGRSFEGIQIDGTPFELLRDRLRIRDDSTNQIPSPAVIAEIERTFRSWSRNRMRFKIAWVLFILGFACGAATTVVCFPLLR
jgi:hypothetical protein